MEQMETVLSRLSEIEDAAVSLERTGGGTEKEILPQSMRRRQRPLMPSWRLRRRKS